MMDILLFNPHAGSIAKSGLSAEQLVEKLASRGIRAAVPHCITEDEMLEVARKSSGRLIVAGGDGTVHAALKAASRRGVSTSGCGAVTVAILPAGTANHLANALGIPPDLDAAIDIIARGHTRRIDLGRVNDTVFSQAAGAGLHARAFHAYGERVRKSAREAASVMAATLADWSPQLMRVTIDGEPYTEELTQITAANTPAYGARFTIAPDARIDDGLLDVVMVGSLSKPEIIRYGVAAMMGRVADMPKTYTTCARRVEIAAAGGESFEIHADAQPVGHTPAVIEVLPECLEVVAPEDTTRRPEEEPR